MIRPSKSTTINYLLHLGAFVLALILYYSSSLLSWLRVLPGSGEDGVKNYYTFAYHVLHSKSFFWFDGMNYPFGEHVLYTDNQPFFSILFKLIHSVIPLDTLLPGLFIVLLLFSMQWGAWFLSCSFRKIGLPFWLSLFSSIGVMLLSPQWLRLGGHYSLAHGFIIPLTLWMCLNYRGRKSDIILLSVLPFLFGLIHPYFLLMTALFIGIYLLLMRTRNLRQADLKQWLTTFLIPIIPLILMQVFLMLTDPVDDRPSTPYGFMHYRATLPSLLLPFHTGIVQWFVELFPYWDLPAAEGTFYIGLVSILGVVIGLPLALFTWWNSLIDEQFKKTLVVLFASLPIALLSIGFPFLLENFEWILGYSGPLRQFRGIGRFSFVFFYAANFFAVVAIYKLVNTEIWKKVLGSLLIVILFAEAYSHSQHIKQQTSKGSANLTQQTTLKLSQDYSCILPIPQFHTGSENFRSQEDMPIISRSMALSLQTGIPLAAVQMSRTSLSQTVALLQLTKSPLQVHPFTKSREAEQWLLMIDPNHPLKVSEKHLIAHSSHVQDFFKYSLSSFNSEDLRLLHDEELSRAQERRKSAMLLESNRNDSIYYKSFDELASVYSFKGQGAKNIERLDWPELIPERLTLSKAGDFELSFWVRYTDPHAVNTQIWYWLRDDESELDFQVTEIGDHIIGFLGEWALCNYPFTVPEDSLQVELRLYREDPMRIWVDEVLLRPLTADVSRDEGININNRYYKPNEANAVQ